MESEGGGGLWGWAEETVEGLRRELRREENGVAVRVVGRAERVTGLDREALVAGLAAAGVVFLATSGQAQQVCNAAGFVYPALRSMAAVRSGSAEDATQWLVYWTVFAAFSLLDFYQEDILAYFRLYWAAKLALLVYLWLPATRGAHRLYKNHLGPAADHLGLLIDDFLNQLAN